MCTTNTLQQKILKRTGNGDLIVNFLADTVEGKHHDTKYHHKLEAAKLLERYGFSDEQEHEESHFWGLIPTPEELAAKKNTPSPSSPPSMSVTPDPDDTPDCYHEPLNPDDQAIFDYQTQIESGEYKEGEITLRQPTPEDWKAYKYALRHITEIAASEGVPLLPNPLADILKMPTIRSP